MRSAQQRPSPARKWRRKRLKTWVPRPESDGIPAAAGPGGELSPHAGSFAPGVASPEEAGPPADPVERPPMEWPESTAVVLAPDPAAPGGFRRMKIRLLRNGVAACADAA